MFIRLCSMVPSKQSAALQLTGLLWRNYISDEVLILMASNLTVLSKSLASQMYTQAVF